MVSHAPLQVNRKGELYLTNPIAPLEYFVS
jgi:hypothetical protein